MWKNYKMAKALPIIKRVKLINRKQCVVLVLNKIKKIFIVFVITLLTALKS